MIRHAPRSTLFPYTTLFRSAFCSLSKTSFTLLTIFFCPWNSVSTRPRSMTSTHTAGWMPSGCGLKSPLSLHCRTMLLIRFVFLFLFVVWLLAGDTRRQPKLSSGRALIARAARTSVRAVTLSASIGERAGVRCRNLCASVSLRFKFPKQFKEKLGAHGDQPRCVIAAMRHDPRQLLWPCVSRPRLVALGLHAGIDEIQML